MLAKFLGFLLFSPQWQLVNAPALGDDTRAAAAEAAPLIPRGGFDVSALAGAATGRGRLQLCVPWIICFLQARKPLFRPPSPPPPLHTTSFEVSQHFLPFAPFAPYPFLRGSMYRGLSACFRRVTDSQCSPDIPLPPVDTLAYFSMA